MKKKIALILFTALILITGFIAGNYESVKEALGYATLTDSNACKTASATTTMKFMTPGTGTTSVSCVTGNAEKIRIFAAFAASSTNTQLRWRVQRSMETATSSSGTWFSDIAPVMELASTTSMTNDFSAFRLTYATPPADTSTSIGFNGSGTTTVSQFSFEVPSSGANLMRVQFYLDATTTLGQVNGAIWAQMVPVTDFNR